MTNRDEALIRAALEMAADEWPKVRVEGGLATAAVLAYADRIRAIPVAEVLAKVPSIPDTVCGEKLRYLADRLRHELTVNPALTGSEALEWIEALAAMETRDDRT